ncbi:MAG TPA: CPBP family intramembrane glutamic endopeptidase [Polyangiaceae bacterium]|nr:CPBP family intramembrane glutamic endopeptidase [Polyangiaceae bacterium]
MTEPQSEGLRMPVGVAAAWASGTILVFWSLSIAVAAFRRDLVSLFACEAVPLLGSAVLVWLVYGQAPLPAAPPPAEDLDSPRPLLPPREPALSFFAVRAAHPGSYVLAFFLGIAIHLPVEAILRLIEQRWPGPPQDIARSFREAGPAMKIVIGSIVVVIGPLVEEIFFRGALFRPLRKASSAGATIALTSITFAVSHFTPHTYVPIGIVGVALGLARHWSGSLIPPFVLHAAFNGLSLVAMATSTGDVADRASPPLWVTLAGTAVTVGLAAGLWALGHRARDGARGRDGAAHSAPR